MHVIPAPSKHKPNGGSFTLPSEVRVAMSKELREHLTPASHPNNALPREIAFPLGELSHLSGHRLSLQNDGAAEIRLGLAVPAGRGAAPASSSNPSVARTGERYRLVVRPDGIEIAGEGVIGVFYGLVTLVQLVGTSGNGAIECCEIDDAPEYSWRGLHLDVGRHFFPPGDVKKLLDLMAFYKLNLFHWHLTEDQGWRIQVDSRPKLTSVGGFRTTPDGGRYGGFYTKDDVHEIVSYASDRHILVLPEIELPGHAQASIAAYPELSCSGEPIEVLNHWGISENVLCAGKEPTFRFLEEVLAEVAELFPSPLFHIGGDECPKAHWRKCPDCQKRIATEGLADEHELQSYVIKRAQQILKKSGKDIIGWDEILEGGLARGAWVMSWRGTKGGIAAANAGHNVVMCPTSRVYFDYRQLDKPGALGPEHFSPPTLILKDVYGFDPRDGLAGSAAARVQGGQANLWTEWMDNWKRVEHMAFPRTCALAETLWTPAARRAFPAFVTRLQAHRGLLDRYGVAYCPDPEAWGAAGA